MTMAAGTKTGPRSGPAASRAVGWLAVGVALAIALGLTLLRAGSDSPPGMSLVARLGFLAAFAGPGLVAAVALRRGRPDVIVAAAVVLICLAPLSMGGATFPFLIPAVILLYVAGRMPRSAPDRLRSRVAGLLAFCLLAAAPILLFSTTETICWDDYGGGNVVTRILPAMPNEVSFTAPFGSGCSSGSVSALGGSLAVLAAVLATLVAAGSSVPPRCAPLVAPNASSAR